MDFEIED